MFIYSIAIPTLFWWLTQEVSSTDRVAPGKFRFTDDIAYLKDEDTAETKIVNQQKEQTVNQASTPTKEAQKTSQHSDLHKHKDDQVQHENPTVVDAGHPVTEIKTQAVGYTIESYPNPVTNPGLCVQSTSLAHSFVCDPDGILSGDEQAELNKLLWKENNYQVFVALAHSILVPANQHDIQLNFAKQLLKAWDNGEMKSVLLVYVENLGQLKVVTNVTQGVLTKENISDIEKTFLQEHSEVFEALKLAIKSVELHIAHSRGSYLYVYLFVVVVALGMFAYVSQRKVKEY